MAFNPEDKVSYEELAPSLQAMIDNAVDDSELEAVRNDLDMIINNLHGIRVSIVQDTSYVTNPQNDKELAIVVNANNNYIYMAIYNSNTWKRIHAVYA